MEIILWILFGLVVAGLVLLVKKPDVKHRTLLGIIVILLGVLGFVLDNWMMVEAIKSGVDANNFFTVLLWLPIIFAILAGWAVYLILPKLDAEQEALPDFPMDEKQKQSKLFLIIYIILVLLLFSIMIAFIFVNHSLKGRLLVTEGLILLIWAVFTALYWVQIRKGFKNYNPREAKFQKASTITMVVVICLGTMANNYAQGHALRGWLLIVEGLFILTAIGFNVYDWVRRWKQMRRKGIVKQSEA